MDFFQNQENAQRKTSLLVFYYIMAVILIILGIYTALVLILQAGTSSEVGIKQINYWNPSLFSGVAAITLLVVSLGSLYKVNQLSTGGKSVAQLLGGTPVTPDTKDPKKAMLLNVVEEISIASGIQIPQVYILEKEKGINAFAAGFNQDDAVVAVTRGCLEQLSRDQLQGVIAHEFSHILYGDMRINIKLMGVLHGILIIAFLGYIVLRSFIYTPRSRRSSGKGGNPLPAILFGLALIIIGYIGVFFGNLIKSAVSRQREYLADASAVQFTRNPSGIAGALKKIAGIDKASLIQNNHAQEASHLFFASNLSGFISKLMSTHPPLQERIKQLDPAFSKSGQTTSSAPDRKETGIFGFSAGGSQVNFKPQDIVASVGTTQSENIKYASQILKNTSDSLLLAARKLPQAEAIIYCLLFSKNNQVKKSQFQIIKNKAQQEAFETAKNIYTETEKLPAQYRLPLLDIAISTLKRSSLESYCRFKEIIQDLIAADGKVSLLEYTIKTMILCHLKPAFEKPAAPKAKYHNLKNLKSECSLLLSYLAHYGINDTNKKSQAFSEAAVKIKEAGLLNFIPTDKCSLKDFDNALAKLNNTSFGLKRKLIEACVTCVIADGEITTRQAELIRITADAIGCPIPPLLPQKINS